METVMRPVTQQRRVELEREAGRPVCQLTVETTTRPRSFLAGEETNLVYLCAKDFGPARQNANGRSTAEIPCSLDYAVNDCLVYKTHGSFLPIVYPELGYQATTVESP